MANNVESAITKEPKIKIDGFQKLIKIANPDLEKEFSGYDLDEQMLISEFTRIFNIKQILYILKTYKPDVKYAKNIFNILHKDMLSLLVQFKNKYNMDVPDENIFDLMMAEINNNFIKNVTNMEKNLHMIALEAFKIEKEFQMRYYVWVTNKNAKNIFNRKKIFEKIEKNINIFNSFETQYEAFINRMSDNEDDDNDVNSFENLYHPKGLMPVTYTAQFIKNTFTFCKCMKNDKSFTAKAFNLMITEFSNKLEIETANPHVMAGHIYYFRLFNIIKLMLLAQEFGVDTVCDSTGIIEILQTPVMKSKDQIGNLLCLDIDQASEIFSKDCSILFGDSNWETPENTELLFCTYLNIERKWMQYDMIKLKKNIKSPYDKIMFNAVIEPFSAVNEYANNVENAINYYEKLNKIDGKVIDFS